jgi:dolichol-phosphate mannosyltransferase
VKPKIIIIGASGFVGAGLFEFLIQENFPVIGIGRKNNPWRITPELKNTYRSTENMDLFSMLNEERPQVIINLAASGAYSFQNDFSAMVNSNLLFLEKIAKWSIDNNCYLINTGSSSEYGINSARPKEDSISKPNSLYAITKMAGTNLLEFYSSLGLKSVVLRLYSVYGPKEDPSRLMPAVMRGVIKGDWPNFTDSTVSRDFVYLDDISQLIVKLIEQKDDSSKGKFNIYNVGTGIKTSIGDLKELLEVEFGMSKMEENKFPKRKWDVEEWYANIGKITKELDWRPIFDIKTGLSKMKTWYLMEDNVKYLNNEYSEKK